MSRTDGAGSGKAASWEMSGGVPPSTRRLGRRIDDIEVLRGLAVTWVVVWHVRGELIDNMPPMLAMFYRYFGGGSGVDLFFVISGFVIARSLMPTLDGGSPSRLFLRQAVAFWVRRAFRLLPSAWLCLAAIVLGSVAFNRSDAFHPFEENVKGALAGFFQVANLYLATTWVKGGGMGSTYHFWSLSLEEQFYLALPFLACLGRRAFPWVAAVLAVFQLVSSRPNPFFLFLRTDALLLGVLIATWSRSAAHARFEPKLLQKSPLLRAGFLVSVSLAILCRRDESSVR